MSLDFKIPTSTLPKNWRELGAEMFNIKPSTVEKIVYGLRNNEAVFKYMLTLAEEEKLRKEQEAIETKKRIDALTK